MGTQVSPERLVNKILARRVSSRVIQADLGQSLFQTTPEEEAEALIGEKEAQREANRLISINLYTKLRRIFGRRASVYFKMYRDLRGVQRGRPVPLDLPDIYRKAVLTFARTKTPIDGKKLSPPVMNALILSQRRVIPRLRRVVDAYRADKTKRGGAQTWAPIIEEMSKLIQMVARDKGLYLREGGFIGSGRARWVKFHRMRPNEERVARLQDEDPESWNAMQRYQKTLEEIDSDIEQQIEAEGRIIVKRPILGKPVYVGVDATTKAALEQLGSLGAEGQKYLSRANKAWVKWWKQRRSLTGEELAAWLKSNPEPTFMAPNQEKRYLDSWKRREPNAEEDPEAHEDWLLGKPSAQNMKTQIYDWWPRYESLRDEYKQNADEFVWDREFGPRLTVEEYKQHRLEKAEAERQLSSGIILTDEKLESLRILTEDELNPDDFIGPGIDTGNAPVQYMSLTDDQAKQSRLTKVFPVKEVPVEVLEAKMQKGVQPPLFTAQGTRRTVKVVTRGRYAGIPLDYLINETGRLVESTEYTFDHGSAYGRPKKDPTGLVKREPFVTVSSETPPRLYLMIDGDKKFRHVLDQIRVIGGRDPETGNWSQAAGKILVPPPRFEVDMNPYQEQAARMKPGSAAERKVQELGFSQEDIHTLWKFRSSQGEGPLRAENEEMMLEKYLKKARPTVRKRFEEQGITAKDFRSMFNNVEYKRRGQYGFYFTPENFALVREKLGGAMALSEGAAKYLEDYFDDLTRAEKATEDKNLAPYEPQYLGNFKKFTRGREGEEWINRRNALIQLQRESPEDPRVPEWQEEARLLKEKLDRGPQLVEDKRQLEYQLLTDPNNSDAPEWERQLEILNEKLSKENWDILGGRPFELNNFQKKSLAWLESRGDNGVIALDTGVGKCCKRDTLINTSMGIVRIEELNPGLTEPDSSAPVEGVSVVVNGRTLPVKSFYYGGEKPTLKITTRYEFELEGSLIHPLLVRTAGGSLEWIKTPDLVVGDYLCVDRSEGHFPVKEPRLPVPSVQKGEKIYPVPSEMNPDLARLLGYIVAEGWTNTPQGFQVTQHRDVNPEVREDIDNLLHAQLGWFKDTYERQPTLQVSSTFLASYLKGLGVVQGISKDKTVPFSVLRSTRESMRQFLRGYVDAECSINPSQGIEFSSASKELSQTIQVMLLRFGILARRRPKIVSGHDHTYWVTHVFGEDCRLFMQRIGLVSRRKVEALSEVLERPGNTNQDIVPHTASLLQDMYEEIMSRWDGNVASFRERFGSSVHNTMNHVRLGRRNSSYRFLREVLSLAESLGCEGTRPYQRIQDIVERNYFYDPVASLERGMSVVMDIEVEDPSHCFVGNGLMNHNTLVAVTMCQKLVRDGWTDIADRLKELRSIQEENQAAVDAEEQRLLALRNERADLEAAGRSLNRVDRNIRGAQGRLNAATQRLKRAERKLSQMEGEEVRSNGRFLYVVPSKRLTNNLTKECENFMDRKGFEGIADRIDSITAKDFINHHDKPVDLESLQKKRWTVQGQRLSWDELPKEEQDSRIKRYQKPVKVYRKGRQVDVANWKNELRNYIAIFFDEAHEYMTKTTGKIGKAFLGLKHPRKIILTASPMTTEPMDAYILSAVCNNIDLSDTKSPEGRKERRDMEKFKQRFCMTVGGRVLGAKEDDVTQKDLHTWARTNLFYGEKTKVLPAENRPKGLITDDGTDFGGTKVVMEEQVEEAYKGVVSAVKDRLQALRVRFKAQGFKEVNGQFVPPTNEVVGWVDPDTGEQKYDNVSIAPEAKALVVDKELENFGAMTVAPFFKLLSDLALAPELATLPKPNKRLMESPKYAKEWKQIQKLYDSVFPGKQPGDRLFPELTIQNNPKYQQAESLVSEWVTSDTADSRKVLLWSDNKDMCLFTAKEMSTKVGGYHVAALENTIHFFKGGKELDHYDYKGKPEGRHELPFRIVQTLTFPGLPQDDKTNPTIKKGEMGKFVTGIVQSNSDFKSMTCYGPAYQSGQNFQKFQRVIHLDRDTWNNENMKQRTARAWRQGQKSDVEVFTLDSVFQSPRGKDDSTLDQIRRLHQELEGHIFDSIVKDAQQAELGTEWSEIKKRQSSFMRLDEKTFNLQVNPDPFKE